MPDLYKPPQPHRVQAVRSARGARRPFLRWWWPVVGLIPVMTVAVLAARGVFTPAQTTPPVAGGPAATATTVTAIQPAPTQVTLAAQAATTPATAATTATTTTSTSSSGEAPATAPTSGTASTGGPFVAYRVQSGDTLRFIGHMYGVSAASIAQASGLSNPDLVRVGQVLTIPAQPGWLYRMQPGETLDQVSSRTGVASERIAAASGLTIASVGTGSVILIPDQFAAASK